MKLSLSFAVLLPLLFSPTLAQKVSLEGLWLSDGYGFFAKKDGLIFTLLEVTKVSCLPKLSAKLEGKGNGVERYIATEARSEGGGPSLFSAFAVGQELHLRFEGAISDVVFKRAARPPSSCGAPTPNTPQSNYATFWQTWSEHYPFFALKRTNWAALDRKVRPTIRAATSGAVLFGKLEAMIAPFQDAHTFLDAPTLNKSFGGSRPGFSPSRDPDDSRILQTLERRYLRGPLRPFCNAQLQYGVLKDGSGYLRIVSFYDYIPGARFGVQRQALKRALDTLLKDVAQRRGLIIDVRLNGGGSDVFGLEVAARLTDQPYLAYRKVVRNDLNDGGSRTPPQDARVRPTSRPSYLGPVVLLIGNDSVSAAETFAMALFGRPQRVTRVGEATQGVFSDVLQRKLPNGWTFGLPNEIYLAQDGRSYDGVGVPPHVRVRVFTDHDLAHKRDSALEVAQRVLAAKVAP